MRIMTNERSEDRRQRVAPTLLCGKALRILQICRAPILRLQFASLLVLGACAEQLPPLPDTVGTSGRGQQIIAVRSMPFHDSGGWREPLRGPGSGFAIGAVEGADASFQSFCPSSDDILMCIGLLPVFVVVGAIVGAAISHSDEEVTQATNALRRTISTSMPTAGVEQAVINQLRATPAKQFEVRSLSETEVGLSYAQLAEEGVDAVLELQVSRLELVIFGRIDPDAAVYYLVRADVVNTSIGPTNRNLSWGYLGTTYNYFEKAADDGLLLRNSIERSYEEVAELIVADLF